MPLFLESRLFLSPSSPTVRPYGLPTSLTLARARSPRHIIKVLITCLLQYFLFTYSLFVLYLFCFILNIVFIWTNTVRTEVAKTVKSEFSCVFCLFVILLFLLPQLVSIRNEALQPRQIRQHRR